MGNCFQSSDQQKINISLPKYSKVSQSSKRDSDLIPTYPSIEDIISSNEKKKRKINI
jgi:hypothetical protein